MTYWHQSGSSEVAAVARKRAAGRVGSLPRGLRLTIGAVVSLSLWVGLAYVAARLLG